MAALELGPRYTDICWVLLRQFSEVGQYGDAMRVLGVLQGGCGHEFTGLGAGEMAEYGGLAASPEYLGGV